MAREINDDPYRAPLSRYLATLPITPVFNDRLLVLHPLAVIIMADTKYVPDNVTGKSGRLLYVERSVFTLSKTVRSTVFEYIRACKAADLWHPIREVVGCVIGETTPTCTCAHAVTKNGMPVALLGKTAQLALHRDLERQGYNTLCLPHPAWVLRQGGVRSGVHGDASDRLRLFF